ncbi:class F sortase [Leekyejoonella antrihumi]|uniref:Class F sortase n=1 Tax=Leekyejoonella antrihumi TaxID=1660198 RepID=A0A563E1J0_9MICO|nr:class F sortase [Leekyejoonella antrihumi]TWP36042.1 class F sortase [Leekyejoonella antrihumi]
MSTKQLGYRGRHLMTAVAAALLAAAIILVIVASRAQVHAASPAASAANPAAEGNLPAPTVPGTPGARPSASSGSSASPSTPPVVGPVLPRSKPVALSIPAIGIKHAHLAGYGTNSTGAIGIPPATGGVPPGWYTGSPTPGQVGPSVIVGHIDSAADGPSIFFRLGQLKPGNTVQVTLADHTVATFRVDSLEKYPKNHFPTQKVYGNINHAGLRLITCAGQFDRAWGHYLDNVVVYAHLVSSHTS